MTKKRVVDIFCGAGGFSEGFRQAGFQILAGIDNWPVATSTFKANHPASLCILDDVERISFLDDVEFDEIIPDSEIIIGSPPCIVFSNSNKSGKVKKASGIDLIEAFLRIVARKKWKKGSILRYWILENVPNSEKFIRPNYSASDLGLPGGRILVTKNSSSGVLDALDFGVPSRRKRYFCGEVPNLEAVTSEKPREISLGDALKYLGKPLEKKDGEIIDPNYDFRLNGDEVTDHHYIQKLARHQWKRAKRLKQDRGYMGRMAFPENLAKPARTILASTSFYARETMVLQNGRGSYRAPTIRESASLMSFPIDYLFYGESIRKKNRLVGNAVPPKLAYVLGKAIASEEGRYVRDGYKQQPRTLSDDFKNFNDVQIPITRERPKHKKSKFKYHIPYLKVDSYRVELTNYNSDFGRLEFFWDVEIHRRQGPKAKVYKPFPNNTWLSDELKHTAGNFFHEIEEKLVGFNEFQHIHCQTESFRRKHDLTGPYELLELARVPVDNLKLTGANASTIEISEEPFLLPSSIAFGYYLLCLVVDRMKAL